MLAVARLPRPAAGRNTIGSGIHGTANFGVDDEGRSTIVLGVDPVVSDRQDLLGIGGCVVIREEVILEFGKQGIAAAVDDLTGIRNGIRIAGRPRIDLGIQI